MAFITNTHKERINYYVSGYIENNYLLCFGLNILLTHSGNALKTGKSENTKMLHVWHACLRYLSCTVPPSSTPIWPNMAFGELTGKATPGDSSSHTHGVCPGIFSTQNISLSFPTTYTSRPTCTHFILILQSLLGDLKGTGLGLVRDGCPETSLGLVFFPSILRIQPFYRLTPSCLQPWKRHQPQALHLLNVWASPAILPQLPPLSQVIHYYGTYSELNWGEAWQDN